MISISIIFSTKEITVKNDRFIDPISSSISFFQTLTLDFHYQPLHLLLFSNDETHTSKNRDEEKTTIEILN
jgi:hypothetical protein